MAQLNNLIVHGATRLLSHLYCKDITSDGMIKAQTFEGEMPSITYILSASAWSSSYPFTYTVSNSFIKASKKYEVKSATTGTETLANAKAIIKNTSYIFAASDSVDNSFRLYAYKRPSVNIKIIIQEVM